MHYSLRSKFALLIFLVSLAAFLFIAVWGYGIIYSETRNTMINALYRDANYLATSYRVNSGMISQGSLESMAYSTGASIWIIDMEGTVETNSGTGDVPARIPAFSAAEGTDGYYMVGDFYGSFPDTMVSVYAPLNMDLETHGYVILHYPDRQLRVETDNRLRIAYISAACLMIALTVFAVLLEFNVVRPIRQVRTSL